MVGFSLSVQASFFLVCVDDCAGTGYCPHVMPRLRVTKFTSRIDVSWTHSQFMGILSKGSKPDNFESPNSVKLIFTNIWGLCSNCIECESFLKSNSRDILALCKTNLDESIDSSNFSVRGLLLLIWKDYYSYVWSCSLYEGRTFSLMGLISRMLSNNLTQMVNFPTQIPDYNSQSCSFGFIFFFDLFVLQCLSLHWEILIMLSHWKLNAPFHDIACYYSAVD